MYWHLFPMFIVCNVILVCYNIKKKTAEIKTNDSKATIFETSIFQGRLALLSVGEKTGRHCNS